MKPAHNPPLMAELREILMTGCGCTGELDKLRREIADECPKCGGALIHVGRHGDRVASHCKKCKTVIPGRL